MDWYPWYPLAFRRKTYQLSLAADGAYRRLIDEYMLNRHALPDDDGALARILGVGLDEWLAIATIVRQFFRPSNGQLYHRRCDQELRAQDVKFARFSARGRKAAFQRWSKNNKQHARRMLNDAYNTSKKERYSSNSESETAHAREESGGRERQATKNVTEALEKILERKGWAAPKPPDKSE